MACSGYADLHTEFDFYPQNHSVVRAEYKYPCIPYELTGVDKVGFFSGFEPVDAILPDVSFGPAGPLRCRSRSD